MNLFDFDPSLKWLFAMTHPDDELSVCGFIHRLAEAGAEVHLSWTHSNPEREAEGRRAAAMLGVAPDRLKFHGATDGRVAEEMPALLPRFRAHIESIRPDRVVCGAFEQGHVDHDATNWLVSRSFSGPVIEAPFYHTYVSAIQTINEFADPEGQQTLALSPSELEMKQRLSRLYESQRIGDLVIWFEVWQAVRLRPLGFWKREKLRLQTHRDYLVPNLPGRLKAAVLRSRRWERWLRAVEAAEPSAILTANTSPPH